MSLNVQRYLARDRQQRQQGLADLYASDQYATDEGRKQSWLEERYGLSIYDAIAYSAQSGMGPDGIVASATGGVDPNAPDPRYTAFLNSQEWATVNENRDVSIWENIGDVIKGASRAAFSFADMGLQGVTNTLTQNLEALSQVPEEGPLKLIDAAAPDELLSAETWQNTDFLIQAGLAVDAGNIQAGFGEEATGDGFFVDPNSEVGKVKDAFAHRQWTLDNGQAATVGRALASGVGMSKDSTEYSTVSGVIDAAVMLSADPLNLAFGLGAASKIKGAAKGSKALGNVADDLASAAEGAQRAPNVGTVFKTGESAELAAQADEAVRAAWLNPEARDALIRLNDKLAMRMGQSAEDVAVEARQADAAAELSWLRGIVNETREEVNAAVRGATDLNDEIAVIGRELSSLDARIAAARRGKPRPTDDAAQVADDVAEAADDAPVENVKDLEAEREVTQRVLDEVAREKMMTRVQETVDELGLADEEAAKAVARWGKVSLQMQDTLSRSTARAYDLDPTDPIRFLKAQAGLTDNYMDANKAFQQLSRGNTLEDMPEVLSHIDRPWQVRALFGGKITPEGARSIAASKSPGEIMGLLLTHSSGLGKFNYKRARWLADMQAQRIGTPDDVAQFSSQARRDMITRVNVPKKADARDAEGMANMLESMVNQVFDLSTAKGSTEKARVGMDILTRNMDNMLNATNFAARKAVIHQTWLEVMDEMPRFVKGAENIDSFKSPEWQSFRKAMKQRFDYDRSSLKELEDRMLRFRAHWEDGEEMIALKELDDIKGNPDLLTFVNSLSYEVSMPDLHAMNRAIRGMWQFDGKNLVLNPTLKNRGVKYGDAGLQFYDTYLRPALLVFRPAYIGLQFMDSTTRAFTYGYTSAWNRPITASRRSLHAMDGNSRASNWIKKVIGEKLYAKASKGAEGITGDDLFKLADDKEGFSDPLEFLLGYSERSEIARLQQESWLRDVMDPRAPKKANVGWVDIPRGGEGFADAWAQEVRSSLVDGGFDLRYKVFEVLRPAHYDTDYPKWLIEWAGRKPKDVDDAIDLATDYFKVGPGRSEIDAVFQANITKPGSDAARYAKTWEDNLRDFLFGDYGDSVARDVQSLTGGWNKDVVSLLNETKRLQHTARESMSGFEKTITINGKTVTLDLKDQGSFNKAFARAVKDVPEDLQPAAARTRLTADVEDSAGASDKLKDFMGAFFEEAAWVGERGIAHTPLMADAYVEEVIKRIPLLPPREAEKAAKALRAEFKKDMFIPNTGIKVNTNSPRVREAFKKLDTAVNNAAGPTGAFTARDIDMSAKAAAAARQFEMFYGLSGRNMTAKRLVGVFPFGQAFVNPLHFYAKAAPRNTKKVLAAQRTYTNMQTQDSGTVYDWFGIREGPTQGLLYWDDYGNRKFKLPLVGWAWGKLTFDPSQPSFLEFDASRFNPINFGDDNPGFSPFIQTAFQAAPGTDQLPEDVKNFVSPYRQFGVSFLPAWGSVALTQALSTATGNPDMMDQYTEKVIGPIMSAMYSSDPARYTDPETGFLSKEGENLLIQDADRFAGLTVIGDTLKKGTFRGEQGHDSVTTDAEGNDVLVSQIKDAYFEALEREDDTGLAVKSVLDEYGVHNVMHLIGRSDYMTRGTEELYQWVAQNGEAAEGFSDVIGFIDPSLDAAKSSMDLTTWQRDHGQGGLKDSEQVVEQANELLFKMRRAEIRQAAADGAISAKDAEARIEALSAQAKSANRKGLDPNWRNEQLAQLRKAVDFNGGELTTQFPAAWAIREYLDALEYAESVMNGKSLKNKENANLRSALLTIGNKLQASVLESTGVDSFGPVWDGFLRQDLERTE